MSHRYSTRPPSYEDCLSSSSSLRAKYFTEDNDDDKNKKNEILCEIQKEYKRHGKYPMKRVQHKNILIISRTRTGKSTIKSLLTDPTTVPDRLTLISETKDPKFQAYHMNEDDIVLNIIDTPGLFEQGSNKVEIRDNDLILRTIGMCINMEITKFHAICFCVSLTTGVNQQDIESLRTLIQYLGPETSKNSCLIITRCESINKNDRERLREELTNNMSFRKIVPYFQLGIFFSGAINRDDLEAGNEKSVYKQFFTICEYREKLIDLFLSITKPISLDEIASSSSEFAREYHNVYSRPNTASAKPLGSSSNSVASSRSQSRQNQFGYYQ